MRRKSAPPRPAMDQRELSPAGRVLSANALKSPTPASAPTPAVSPVFMRLQIVVRDLPAPLESGIQSIQFRLLIRG